jgi:hypothetical protein
MAATQEKLLEAKFFLDKLRASIWVQPDFDYYLNAFLGSARSVLWIMRAEYSDTPGWEEWYKSKELNALDVAFLRDINELRIESTKRSSVRTKPMVQFEIPEHFVTGEVKDFFQRAAGKNGKGTIGEIGPLTNVLITIEGKSANLVVSSIKPYRGISSLVGEDALETCVRYYGMMEEIVSECRKYFDS